MAIPEGMTVVPTAMVEEMVETLWHRANLVYGGRPPAWLDLGHKLVLGDALDPIVGSYDAPTESLDAGRLAYSAAWLGTVSRRVELDAAGEPHVNDDMTEFLNHAYKRETWRTEWSSIAVGTAMMLNNGARRDPENKTFRELTAPDGLGSTTRRQLAAYGLARLTNEIDEESISQPRLQCSWDYGYYLGVVEPLPWHAWAELAD